MPATAPTTPLQALAQTTLAAVYHRVRKAAQSPHAATLTAAPLHEQCRRKNVSIARLYSTLKRGSPSTLQHRLANLVHPNCALLKSPYFAMKGARCRPAHEAYSNAITSNAPSKHTTPAALLAEAITEQMNGETLTST